MLVSILHCSIIVLIASEIVYPVSIRRRKHLFGQQWDPNQIESQITTPVEQPSEVAIPESSAVTTQEQAPEQVKRKRGRPRVLIKKPKRKSTESVRKWFARKKEESERGDKKAIEFFAKRTKYKMKKVREKTARIQQGTATPLEQEQYRNLRMKQKQWRDNNREKRNTYLRKWKKQRKENTDN